jgi:hypothetical protein
MALLPTYISINQKQLVMSVSMIQRETTYDVEYNDVTYSVTVLEDKISLGYTQYDVFDEDGDEVTGELEEMIINYFEENL